MMMFAANTHVHAGSVPQSRRALCNDAQRGPTVGITVLDGVLAMPQVHAPYTKEICDPIWEVLAGAC